MDEISIDFANGRRAVLVELRQSLEYEGLLEGLPTREMNARSIEAFQGRHPDVHLIRPVEIPLDWGEARPYPFGEPASLPAVRCLARLQGYEDDALFTSEGLVAWFQHEWAPPIEDAALAAFRQIDWPSVSRRFEL